MFWVDKIAKEIKERNLSLEWVDDMKTPSGKVHVGALRGVVIHDLAFKALQELGVNAKYTYIFDNHDPMDGLPIYLDQEKYSQYLGLPLYKVPSPVEGYENYAEYYAKDFMRVFNTIGCTPEILWSTDLYKSGKMNDLIRLVLDKRGEVREIYEQMYSNKLKDDWYPFQVYCTNCGKVSTTQVTGWDGNEVSFTCHVDRLDWTHGCGFSGTSSPFSDENEIRGKLPWKIEWSAKWKALGVTVEGAGKDHMSRGGSHDLTSIVCEKIFNYPVPYPIPYEFFLVGGKKMSSSKGLGSSAADMLEILPPELLRFLMVRTKMSQAINFDPSVSDTIPDLFDEYQEAAEAYKNKDGSDLARIYELSQIDGVKEVPVVRFKTLVQWVQMPNMGTEIEKEGLLAWAKYAKVWIDRFAPERDKFLVQKNLPDVGSLNEMQKEYLATLTSSFEGEISAEELQLEIYNKAKEKGISSIDAFKAIYLAFLGKDHGPKAAWLLQSLDRDFVKTRLIEAASANSSAAAKSTIVGLNKPEIFSIDRDLKEKCPSISVGTAVIRGVSITKTDHELENEKELMLKSLENLTTEELGEYEETKSYRSLYKEMGVDWHSRRPSPEALLRRIALKKGLYTINTCVDAYNLVVMKNRISVGAFDLDRLKLPTVLRLAKEGEQIHLLGDESPTNYTDREIAYFDQDGGYNIDFNYRDAQRTAVQLETKNIIINVDGIYDITPQDVERVLRETCDIILKYCGGEVTEFGVEAAV